MPSERSDESSASQSPVAGENTHADLSLSHALVGADERADLEAKDVSGAQAALDAALANAAAAAVRSPEISHAISEAARRSISNSGVLGIGTLGSSAVNRAVNEALVEEAKSAVRSPEISHAISEAARRSISNSGVLGIGTLGSSAVNRAVNEALVEEAKSAVRSPEISHAISEAARRSISNSGVLGIRTLGSSAVNRAVNEALVEEAKSAVRSPEISHAISDAARRSISNSGVLGIRTLGSSAVNRAVNEALVEEAKSAVRSPEISHAISNAARRNASSPWALGPDPALAFALQQQARTEPRETPEQADALTRELEVEPPVTIEGVFSDGYASPGSFFAAHEVVINSFAELTGEIQALAAKNRDLSFVWRGQQNADWGLHSSLYRRLMDHYQVKTSPAPDSRQENQSFPDETTMLTAELALLDEAIQWRMSETPALELFARLQHQGGPSRLLDVTRNPLIATWFAVEAGVADDASARLFALATGPVVEGTKPRDSQPVIKEVLASSRYPFWTYRSPQERTAAAWGTGSRRRIWVPPAYDGRIAAQNAAFLLEGVPMLTRKTLRLFQSGIGNRHWNAVDVAASMSIYARPTHPHKRARPTKAMLAPLFSFRITAAAKSEIRDMLDRTYGYTAALLYPDIQGMSSRLLRSDWLGARGS